MDFIIESLKKQEPSFEELVACLEKIKSNGEVAVIKFDGQRKDSSYTVFISFPDNNREMIRADESDLKKALVNVLLRYVEEYRT